MFLPLCQKKDFFGKMMNKKLEVTNLAKNRKQKNTNWHQNLSQKSSKTPFFVVRKWSPQEVVLFLTLEVVLFLALEGLKRGTKTNSPAYIYIYACCRRGILATKWRLKRGIRSPTRVRIAPGAVSRLF